MVRSPTIHIHRQLMRNRADHLWAADIPSVCGMPRPRDEGRRPRGLLSLLDQGTSASTSSCSMRHARVTGTRLSTVCAGGSDTCQANKSHPEPIETNHPLGAYRVALTNPRATIPLKPISAGIGACCCSAAAWVLFHLPTHRCCVEMDRRRHSGR
jgi:hypothetical protein